LRARSPVPPARHLGLAAASLAVIVALAACAQPLPASVTLAGHGWGHGRGMSQWGALGYAVDHGWSTGAILDHYYGGTSTRPLGSNPDQRVFLRSREARDLVVRHERGQLAVRVDGTLLSGQYQAVRIHRVSAGFFELFVGTGCDGPWSSWRTASASEIDLRSTATDDVPANLLQLCSEDGTRAYRGRLAAVEARGTIETVNVVGTESLVRSVIAREVSASWADLGSGRGAAAVRAQAVAARSYAVAGDRRWGTFASTCDDTSCQVYSGVSFRPAGGALAVYEDRRTDQAVAETAGLVRTWPDGRVASTEFSSSSGGWTTGGAFPAVVDDGDGVAANPNHDWTVVLPATVVETAFDDRMGRDVGALEGIDVIARNGLGADGGRVLAVTVRFTGTDVTLTGNELRSTLRLKSDWFVMR
jgi:peptidoglycan hydrolase-like amidase